MFSYVGEKERETGREWRQMTICSVLIFSPGAMADVCEAVKVKIFLTKLQLSPLYFDSKIIMLLAFLASCPGREECLAAGTKGQDVTGGK